MLLIVNTNSNTCHIYSYSLDDKIAKLALLKEIIHPQSRLKNSELTADKPGHYQAGESARSAYSPHMDAKQVEVDKFARDIAVALNHERNTNGFDKLIIISPPHMQGVLALHLDKQVAHLITQLIHKDLQHYSERELLDFLKNECPHQLCLAK